MTDENYFPAGTPLIMAASAPIKLFAKDESDSWRPTLEQINRGTYDHLKLNRASGFIDGNVAPYAMLVGFDGTLALPAFPEFEQRDKALQIFNRVFLEMLLGGIYTEAAAPADIFHGMLYETGYIRVFSESGHTARLHSTLRDRSASNMDTIGLLDLKPITVADLETVVKQGRRTLSKCHPLSHEIVLSACSHFVAGALAEALTCLWTSIEQLISRIWKVEVIDEAPTEGVPQRSGFLKDFRVWTTSARIELLFQKKILNADLYSTLNVARKARNDFVHSGAQPQLSAATAALSGLFYLISLCASDYADIHTLDGVRLKIEDRCILRPRPQGPIAAENVGYWRHIEPLPGEEQFKGHFTPFELQFEPVTSFDPKRAKKAARQTTSSSEAKSNTDDSDDSV